MRRIVKIFNNNVVSAVDEHGDELVVAGSGVGYLRKRGDEVDPGRIEKEFHLTGRGRDGSSRVLLSLPYEVLVLTAAIGAHLESAHGLRLPQPVEIGLADHLASSLRRLDEGTTLPNSMLWETKLTYPQEFGIALQVLDIVADRTGRQLPVDEAGFIALHLVNAGLLTDTGHAYTLGATLRRVVEIVQEDLGVAVDGGSTAHARFLSHLKFVVQRLTQRRIGHGEFPELFEARRAHDPEGYRCAVHVAEYLHDAFGTELSDDELMYLMLHLARLREDAGADPTPAAAATDPTS